MASKHTLFRVFYRIGFTPWDGHPIAQNLRDLVEGTDDAPPLPVGSALDLGCGTGDSSLYLAQHGWKVTGVDFVTKALDKARAKAGNLPVDFVEADVTRLSQSGIGTNFQLIVDNGCLHNMSDVDRDAYAREVSAVAASDAMLLIVAFLPGGRFGVRGIEPGEMKPRFAAAWTLMSTGQERDMDQARLSRRGEREENPARYYLFTRRDT
jgi:SAM-dependent methyltransferase